MTMPVQATGVTCFIKYILDPRKTDEFEKYAKMWIPLVDKLGGKHLGYFLPHEGADNIAYAAFNFPSLAEYERYRLRIRDDEDCHLAFEYAAATQCFLNSERTFMRPVMK